MIVEITVLALASTVRPTSLAAVSALLAHKSARRLLLAYIVGGLVFTLAFGVLVVGGLHGIHLNAGSNPTRGVADILGGVVALLLFGAVLSGRVPRRSGLGGPGPVTDTPVSDALTSGRGGWKARLDRQLTVPAAAIAGPLTHLPGLFYLIALNLIVAHSPRVPGGIVAVSIYDVIWFAVPLGALAMAIVNPTAAQAGIASVQRWTVQHGRTLLLGVSLGVGLVLLIRGILTI